MRDTRARSTEPCREPRAESEGAAHRLTQPGQEWVGNVETLRLRWLNPEMNPRIRRASIFLLFKHEI